MMGTGGYFELELRKGIEYHNNALALNTGRNALELILITKKYIKVYIPFYTCDAILEPFIKHKISYEFYSINVDFEPIFDFSKINNEEGFLYTNYFGLKDSYILKLSTICLNLIIDNTQSFYSKPINGIPTFYSCRKFFGVPDGAYVYLDGIDISIFETDYSENRINHLLKRIEFGVNEGYNDFRKNDNSLMGQPILRMSKLTKALICNVDYETVKNKRIENFTYLYDYLSEQNELQFMLDDDSVPMVYPFLSNRKDLKTQLKENRIYVATYWPNVFDWCNIEQLEYKMAEQIIYLPIDQRYSENDMKKIVSLIK